MHDYFRHWKFGATPKMSMHIFIKRSLVICLLCFGVSDLNAQIITNSFNGTLYETSAVTGAVTEGDDLAGLFATVTFSDLSTEVVNFAATGDGTGEAAGTNWLLGQGPGTTFTNAFTLTNDTGLGISSLLLHGGGTNTVFDRPSETTVGGTATTPGSTFGLDIFETGTTVSSNQTVLATYHDLVTISGAAPVGDLYAGLEINFADGLDDNSSFSFITDTDTTATNLIVSTPSTSAVPEPSGLVPLLCMSLAFLKRRRS